MHGGVPPERTPSPSRRNGLTALVLAGVVVGMVGLSFASVPLYRVFCQVTGLGGTVQRGGSATAAAAAMAPAHAIITIRFDATVAAGLPWRFSPEVPSVTIPVGETTLVNFHAENLTDAPVTGQAVYNVSPDVAGLYFHKIQCFCFTEQRLEPHEAVDMPVTFYVDPEALTDPNFVGADTITLSYTFYRAPESDSPAPAANRL